MTNCTTCAVAQGYKPAEALHGISDEGETNMEPVITMLENAIARSHAKHGVDFRFVELPEFAAEMLIAVAKMVPAAIKHNKELEQQLAAIGAGGVEPLRKAVNRQATLEARAIAAGAGGV